MTLGAWLMTLGKATIRLYYRYHLWLSFMIVNMFIVWAQGGDDSSINTQGAVVWLVFNPT